MTRLNKLWAVSSIAMLGATGAAAHDSNDWGDWGSWGASTLQGVWQTRVSIVNCANPAIVFAGPFPGLLTFHADGTLAETAPAPPNSQRSVSHGVWYRIDRNTFQSALTFQRLDVTGIFLGTQVIRATSQVIGDSYTANGTFETKDASGATIGSGCSAVTATRFK
jgi:hypothetical protein